MLRLRSYACSNHHRLHPGCRLSQFIYLGSTTSDIISLDVELGERIGKAVTNTAKLPTRLWENRKLTTQTKIAVYRASIVNTLLYGSEFWTTYAGREKRLHIFNMRCFHRILSISWTDKVSNSAVLERAGISSMYTLLRQLRLSWLGHVRRIKMVESLRSSCKVSSNLGRGLLADLSYASGMSARETCFRLVCNRQLGTTCSRSRQMEGRQSWNPKPTQSQQWYRLLQRQRHQHQHQQHQAISVGTLAVSALHKLYWIVADENVRKRAMSWITVRRLPTRSFGVKTSIIMRLDEDAPYTPEQ